jgi:hypothetical protein
VSKSIVRLIVGRHELNGRDQRSSEASSLSHALQSILTSPFVQVPYFIIFQARCIGVLCSVASVTYTNSLVDFTPPWRLPRIEARPSVPPASRALSPGEQGRSATTLLSRHAQDTLKKDPSIMSRMSHRMIYIIAYANMKEQYLRRFARTTSLPLIQSWLPATSKRFPRREYAGGFKTRCNMTLLHRR